MADAGVKELKEFFEMDAATFMREWKNLTDEDKAQLKAGVGNGTFTY